MQNAFLFSATAVLLAVGAATAQTTTVVTPGQPVVVTQPQVTHVETTDPATTGGGAMGGATTGAVAGAVVGGPVGAAVGGIAGAIVAMNWIENSIIRSASQTDILQSSPPQNVSASSRSMPPSRRTASMRAASRSGNSQPS